ncbi:UNVERIFIED_CONTAM: putative ATP-dependent DNA helicase CHR12 [Sesamum radiatum]|uniref:ATP-dependent DNA helicase CHR12 n=1 Tax=Sesamum radiatum TaxID=300843 RepID=A0AAW2UBA3_SESRA
MVAQVAEPQPSTSQQLGIPPMEHDPQSENPLASAKTLICALNFISRNLPLPQHVYDAVSSIYQDPSSDTAHEVSSDADDEVEGDVRDGETPPLRTVGAFVFL